MKVLGLKGVMELLNKEGYKTMYDIKKCKMYIINQDGEQVATIRSNTYFEKIVPITKRITCTFGVDYRRLK